MSTNTLNLRSAGQIIVEGFFNDFNLAFNGDFVGRNSSGVPESGQALGTVAFPWGAVRANALILAGTAVDTSQITSPVNRVVSGKTRSTSNQPQFITPNGSALSFIIAGATKNLVLDINGSAVTVNTDLTKSSLTAAPSSQNTALVNDSEATGQEDTRLWGEAEHRKAITIDTVGTNITALVGKYAAFKIGTEYFITLVESSTKLSKALRGHFYDSSGNPMNRTTFSDNATITLEKLGWVFVENDATTVDVTYTNPTWAYTAPSSPATGDYWNDTNNKVWKRYDGATFIIVNRTLIGYVINNTTACVGARCQDFYAQYSSDLELPIEKSTTEIIKAIKTKGRVSVAGQTLRYEETLPTWNITTDLATSADMYNATEQASTVYYVYVSDLQQPFISDISPYHRSDLDGAYHPHNPWRCVGHFFNDAGSDIAVASSVDARYAAMFIVDDNNGFASVNASSQRWVNLKSTGEFIYTDSSTLGAKIVCVWPGIYSITHTNASSVGSVPFYIAVNSAIQTAPPTIDEQIARVDTPTTNKFSEVSGSTALKIGDVVNLNGAGNAAPASPTEAKATIKRVN